MVGGKSLIDYAPTHVTSGIEDYIAVDIMLRSGTALIAPERVVVEKHDTSANPGEALYLDGLSGLDYWFGHIDRDWSLGHVFNRGDFIARVANQWGNSHLHAGINGEQFLGQGRGFRYGYTGHGPNYTVGSPTYRQQLNSLNL